MCKCLYFLVCVFLFLFAVIPGSLGDADRLPWQQLGCCSIAALCVCVCVFGVCVRLSHAGAIEAGVFLMWTPDTAQPF